MQVYTETVMSLQPQSVVVGVDLAGSPRRPTGVCVLQGMKAKTCIAFTDEEILESIHQARPDLVPIDAPLSLPNGRKTIHERSGEHLRECDRALQRRKIRFFPITLGPMRMLTERGLALKEQIEKLGYRAVECYPGAAQDIWGIPRQHRDLGGLLRGLKKLGLKGLTTKMTSDELDAVTAALVGRLFLMGSGEMLGGEDGILIPVRSGPIHVSVEEVWQQVSIRMIKRIVSGAQTGADRAALDFALQVGIDCGGWVPKGRIAEDGVIPAYYPNLRETESDDPGERTERNVRDSDGTLLVTRGTPTGGSALTLEVATRLDKPVLHVDLERESVGFASRRLLEWLQDIRPSALNIAGPRTSEDREIYELTRALLEKTFRHSPR